MEVLKSEWPKVAETAITCYICAREDSITFDRAVLQVFQEQTTLDPAQDEVRRYCELLDLASGE